MQSNYLKALGPGLLWAGAAVGVSHLVQSTRAGASFGLELLGLVIIANIFKYPAFSFGQRNDEERQDHGAGSQLLERAAGQARRKLLTYHARDRGGRLTLRSWVG